jgi:hypothetical protein
MTHPLTYGMASSSRRSDTRVRGSVTPDMEDLSQLWERSLRARNMSPKTVEVYVSAITKLILPQGQRDAHRDHVDRPRPY